ncbi:hypothetical protein [Rhodococcus sp. NCIMB 12038]|uniref:hypothetical protein n=1 Tax=Rhodococcus sp. NCIMB 12038 TaxID=933800 RepID=UPI000B3C9632|nr:hypothetical protein [Rhodococcus sp. NCIMB 12038]OUS97378.1 hypothetical protein CA951_03270 [Rhodococcus sp. NCIMB 12038]
MVNPDTAAVILADIDETTRQRDNLVILARDASGEGKHDIAANHLRAAARRSELLVDMHKRHVELGVELPGGRS